MHNVPIYPRGLPQLQLLSSPSPTASRSVPLIDVVSTNSILGDKGKKKRDKAAAMAIASVSLVYVPASTKLLILLGAKKQRARLLEHYKRRVAELEADSS